MVEITLPIVLQILQTAGLLVGIFYYIMTLQNQIKTRHMQIIEGVESQLTSSPGFNYNFLRVEWEDYDDFITKYGPESESDVWDNNSAWLDAFERYGVYVHEGMLDIRILCLLVGGVFTVYWEKYGPFWLERRKRIKRPRLFIESEYLYNRMKEYLDKHPELAT